MQVNKIKKDWNRYVVTECSGRADCRVSATANIPSVSLDCDALKMDDAFKDLNGKYGKSSDCILIEYDGITQVAVIEFKSKWTDGTGAAKQVIAGCRIAKILLSHYSHKKKPKIYLIVSACGQSNSVKKKFLQEVRKSGEDIENAITAGCHEKFKDLRNRKRDF